jgi:hypothetical protein
VTESRRERRRWKREDQTRYNQDRAIVYRTYSKELEDTDRLEADDRTKYIEKLREQLHVILLLSSDVVTQAAVDALKAADETLAGDERLRAKSLLEEKRDAFIQAAREELGVERLQTAVDLPRGKPKIKIPFGTRPKRVIETVVHWRRGLLPTGTEEQQRQAGKSPNSEDKEQKNLPG